jgi:hypothetical protein
MRGTPICAGFVWVLFFVASAYAQSQQSRTLTIEGQSGQAPVIQANGKSCVEIDALAKLTSGSLRFSGDQIILTLNPHPASQPESRGLSKAFLNQGIEAMSAIREWRSALESAIRYGFPANDDWVTRYRNAAVTSVQLASVAASTDSDRNASQLVSKQLDNMQQLSDKMLAARGSATYIAPDALASDPLDQKIISCAHALSAMAASGQFNEDSSCR